MRIHRDRPSDDVRAAKAGPPLRGWPWQAAGFVERLGRAARPALRPRWGPLRAVRGTAQPIDLPSRLPRPIPATSGTEYGP